MIMEIRTEKLIKAVEKRPALYNRSDSNYFCHRKTKSDIWTEVCKEIFDGWNDFKPQEKVELGHEVQKRWKSLRTCFARELAAQKKEQQQQVQHDGLYKRRKRYEYYDMLTFLLEPTSGGGESGEGEGEGSDDDSSDPLDNNVKSEPFLYEVMTEPAETRFQNANTSRFENPSTSHHEDEANLVRPFARSEHLEVKVLDMLKEYKKDEEDEDKQFLLSLVPSFRKLKDKQKFEARIEILKVLKDISFRDSND